MPTPQPLREPLLTMAELVAWLKVDQRTVYRYTIQLGFPCYRLGGRYRFKASEIEAWMKDEAAHTVGTPEEVQRGRHREVTELSDNELNAELQRPKAARRRATVDGIMRAAGVEPVGSPPRSRTQRHATTVEETNRQLKQVLG